MDWKRKENQRLIEALLTIQNADQAKRFLRDLMTEGEINEFAKRLKTAEMLSDKISYSNIEKETGFSSTTVARVSKWLNDGTGGYKEIIKNMHRNNPIKLRK
jgi:TrpR-related protein YerC/YecD